MEAREPDETDEPTLTENEASVQKKVRRKGRSRSKAAVANRNCRKRKQNLEKELEERVKRLKAERKAWAVWREQLAGDAGPDEACVRITLPMPELDVARRGWAAYAYVSRRHALSFNSYLRAVLEEASEAYQREARALYQARALRRDESAPEVLRAAMRGLVPSGPG